MELRGLPPGEPKVKEWKSLLISPGTKARPARLCRRLRKLMCGGVGRCLGLQSPIFASGSLTVSPRVANCQLQRSTSTTTVTVFFSGTYLFLSEIELRIYTIYLPPCATVCSGKHLWTRIGPRGDVYVPRVAKYGRPGDNSTPFYCHLATSSSPLNISHWFLLVVTTSAPSTDQH
ncbi:hypothetical protein F5888DRAFT_1245511 [Russula emetica]|nr:hypothetical protein F5888DRAFT_1245511 [Russula emetica]